MEAKSDRLKERYKLQYREANKAVKTKTRADKRAFVEDLANQAEEAANKGEQGKNNAQNGKLYINFVDFEKAFDSIHRDSLWRILRKYGIPEQLVLVIKSFYTNFTCRVGNSNHKFQVKTGVRQGCVMSALLFNIAIDWVMRQATEGQKRGIRWTLFPTLEDLDFKRGRPKNTWRRTVEGEIKDLNHTWGTIQKLVHDRKEWKTFVAALCARRQNGQ
ncbi:hypothetical protein BSL78_07570 [Apostichopus japonicus]|uniref:Reverse transcriptase domain-containing protein n=1 Tax=Stichopus japonicus TaxID=307972 RepID=A0A2G8L5J9_STIJA|nr:hypothetical protein BSL78_07570 [Apostichopus japonicus]